MDHAAHETVQFVAACFLVFGGAVFILASLRQRSAAPRSGGPSRPVATVRRSLVLIMAGLSAGAAIIHLVAAPGHYAEIGDLALGFIAAAAFQAAWVKACLSGPSPRTAAIGIVVNVAIVAAWAYTRAIGLPIGEFGGSPEPIGFPDGASVLFELLLVGSLLLSWFGLDVVASHRPAARTMASIAVVPVIGLIVVTTSLATVAIASGSDHGATERGSMSGEHAARH